jgi:hypothetical protein
LENKKGKGSFYTPRVIADFLVNHIAKKSIKERPTFLEPSAGDGIFVDAVYSHPKFKDKIKQFVAVEREESEYQKVLGRTEESSLKAINADFLDYQLNNQENFDIVIAQVYIKVFQSCLKTLLRIFGRPF